MTRRLTLLLLAAVALLTVGGFALKAQCIDDYDRVRDSHLCSNDVQVLYRNRGMADHPFPYVHGDYLGDGKIVGGALEYPVLTGLFAWVPAVFVHDDGGYLELTALLLAPFSFLTVWLLGRMVRWRALLYALAPPLVWYSFHNWDLLVVCAAVGAFYAWWRGEHGWAAVWLAVGGSLKLWPLFFLLPLVLDRLHAGSGVRRVLAFSVGTTLAINLPFVIASPRGWWAPYAFQQDRGADITSNSVWYWGLPELSTDQLNTIIPVLLLLGTVVACAWGWYRAQEEGVFPFVQVCGAVLVLFLLTNKAHSPQYALWLLPFFCLVRLRWGWFAAYMVLDALLYVGLFRWYASFPTSNPDDGHLAYQALVLGVWGRAAVLALLYVVLLRSRTALSEQPVST